MTTTKERMLGTEAVRAMREKGVKAKISGLSANQGSKQAFLDAGADCFLLKPLNCKKDDLAADILRILSL